MIPNAPDDSPVYGAPVLDLPMAAVVWVDSTITHEQLSIDEAKDLRATSCTSVGWIVADYADRIVIALEQFSDHEGISFRNIVVIPHPAILSVQPLRTVAR